MSSNALSLAGRAAAEELVAAGWTAEEVREVRRPGGHDYEALPAPGEEDGEG